MKPTSNQIHNISLANNFLAAKDKAHISNTTVRIQSTKRINPNKTNNLTKPEYTDINGSYAELCMTVCECQLVASGRNNLVRNTIVIDCDFKHQDLTLPIQKRQEVIEFFKKRNIYIQVIQKLSGNFQVHIPVEQIRIAYLNSKLERIHTDQHTYYLRLLKLLSLKFGADLNFRGFWCQNPAYAYVYPEKYLFTYNTDYKDYRLNSTKTISNLYYELLEEYKSNYNLNLESNDFEPVLSSIKYKLNIDDSNSRSLTLSKQLYKIIGTDTKTNKLKDINYYMNLAYILYQDICSSLNKHDKKASVSEINAIVRSAYKANYTNFKITDFNKNRRHLSLINKTFSKLKNLLQVRYYKKADVKFLSKKLNLSDVYIKKLLKDNKQNTICYINLLEEYIKYEFDANKCLSNHLDLIKEYIKAIKSKIYVFCNGVNRVFNKVNSYFKVKLTSLINIINIVPDVKSKSNFINFSSKDFRILYNT
nr:MAG TPA: hypothetical protein [Caudoviricetes sp.]